MSPKSSLKVLKRVRRAGLSRRNVGVTAAIFLCAECASSQNVFVSWDAISYKTKKYPAASFICCRVLPSSFRRIRGFLLLTLCEKEDSPG